MPQNLPTEILGGVFPTFSWLHSAIDALHQKSDTTTFGFKRNFGMVLGINTLELLDCAIGFVE
jgi:hypothetical protein